MAVMATELLYLRDAYLLTVEATVTDVDVEGRRIALDRTVFYPTGGGQPHDTGELAGLARDRRAQGRRARLAHARGRRPAAGGRRHRCAAPSIGSAGMR